MTLLVRKSASDVALVRVGRGGGEGSQQVTTTGSEIAAPEPGRLLPMVALQSGPGAPERQLALLDDGGRLWHFSSDPAHFGADGYEDDVTGVVQHAVSATIAYRSRGGRGRVRLQAPWEGRAIDREIPGSGDFRLLFGARSWITSPTFGLIGVAHQPGQIAVLDEQGFEVVPEPSCHALIGLRNAPRPETSQQGNALFVREPVGISSGLLVLEADRRTVSWRTAELSEVMLLAPRPITAAALNPLYPQIALILEGGELWIHSFEQGLLLRVLPERLPR
jgi:hypothetical protein